MLVQAISLEQQWHSWKLTHVKVYMDISEEQLRRQIWGENVAMIQDHNNKVVNFSLAINQFADLVST